jgi:hypothetical protein
MLSQLERLSRLYDIMQLICYQRILALLKYMDKLHNISLYYTAFPEEKQQDEDKISDTIPYLA